MPRKDAEARRQYARDWMSDRRRSILAAHPCPCGQPATTIMFDPGTGKITWSRSLERIKELLAAKRLRCDACAAREAGVPSDDAVERDREGKRVYMQRVRGSRSRASATADSPDPARATSPGVRTGRRGSGGKAQATTKVETVFDDPAWRAERRRARQARRAALGMTKAEPTDPEADA